MAMRRSLLRAALRGSSTPLVPSPGGSPSSFTGRLLGGAVEAAPTPARKAAVVLLPRSSSTTPRSLLAPGLCGSVGTRYYWRAPQMGHQPRQLIFKALISSDSKEEMEGLKKTFDYLDEKCQDGLKRLAWYEKVSYLWWSIYASGLLTVLIGLHLDRVELRKLRDDINEQKASKKSAAGVQPQPPSPPSPSTPAPGAPRSEPQDGTVMPPGEENPNSAARCKCGGCSSCCSCSVDLPKDQT